MISPGLIKAWFCSRKRGGWTAGTFRGLALEDNIIPRTRAEKMENASMLGCSGSSPPMSARSRGDWLANVTGPLPPGPMLAFSGCFCQHCRLSSKVRVLPDPQSRDVAAIAEAWPRHFLGIFIACDAPQAFWSTFLNLCAQGGSKASLARVT